MTNQIGSMTAMDGENANMALCSLSGIRTEEEYVNSFYKSTDNVFYPATAICRNVSLPLEIEGSDDFLCQVRNNAATKR